MCATTAAMAAASFMKPPGVALADTRPRNVVLLVEDNDFVAGLMTCVVQRRGQQVVRARDGAEAERLFKEWEPAIALVIMDCRLPDDDGRSVCRRLRCRSQRLPVLFTSGQDWPETPEFAEPHTGFLTKPFLPTQLQRQMDAVLGAIV